MPESPQGPVRRMVEEMLRPIFGSGYRSDWLQHADALDAQLAREKREAERQAFMQGSGYSDFRVAVLNMKCDERYPVIPPEVPPRYTVTLRGVEWEYTPGRGSAWSLDGSGNERWYFPASDTGPFTAAELLAIAGVVKQAEQDATEGR